MSWLGARGPNSIVTAAPPFEVSPNLENILKKHRFDLPPGIENNPVDFGKVVVAMQEAFTQLRAKSSSTVPSAQLLLNFVPPLHSCLITIRAQAKGNVKKITKAFRQILTKDQEQHSVKDYEISDASVDNFQQEVDDLINAGATDLATSVAQPQAENLIFVAFISPANIFVFYLSILRPAISTTETSPMKPAGTHPNQLGCHQLDLDP
ncbi:hypothetical protein B0H10DRAFT_1954485 [Mycena sp. CBHHK59/15]|nr:hypothetical protein B0H10DRAFT_1954485 [Mycena sp. CBHHK59/15]